MMAPDANQARREEEADGALMPDTQAESTARPRKPLTGILQIAGVVALVAVAVVYSQDRPAAGRGAAAAAAPAVAAPIVTVSVIQPVTTARTLQVRATGSVVVRSYVSLTPQVGGQIVAVSPALRAGGRFSAGEELLRVESRDYRLALDQARADVAAAESTLKLQQAESDAARANFALVQPGKPVPPLVAKIPQIEQAEARLASARARADIAALDLARTVFSLPFAGRITQTTAGVGQVLTRGQPFGQAFALDAVEAVAPVAAPDLALLDPVEGRRVQVIADEITVTGVVERVSAELDSRSRFARLYLALDERDALKPGTFADVIIDGPEVANVFVLPAAAEQSGGELWIVDAEGMLRAHRPSTRGRSEEGWIVDAFDFAGGVVIGSVPGGREGLAVRAVEG